MAGAAAREAQRRMSEREFAQLFGRAHQAGLQAAWGVFAEAVNRKRFDTELDRMIRILSDHHPSKLAG